MAAAEVAAQLGLGTAASYAIDKGIKKGIPTVLRAGRKLTKNSKFKPIRKISRGIEKVEKAYGSKYGKVGQEAASVVGGLLAFHGAGKAVGSLKKAGASLASRIPSSSSFFKKGSTASRAYKYAGRAAEKFNQAKTNLGEKI
jgi:hypothetical protein